MWSQAISLFCRGPSHVKRIAVDVGKRGNCAHMACPDGKDFCAKQLCGPIPPTDGVGDFKLILVRLDNNFPIRGNTHAELASREGSGNGFARLRGQALRLSYGPEQRTGVEKDHDFPSRKASASSSVNGRSQPSFI